MVESGVRSQEIGDYFIYSPHTPLPHPPDVGGAGGGHTPLPTPSLITDYCLLITDRGFHL
ncbi:MAG: hypothetical protein EWV53_16400 [Microcystis panniformis Mp_MB_F_20051200_S9]|uniref:Uncharacterized protein n=1 Tax=Microcystis panniformis Mp_MB_F_20051200_S9 TaxID=2486223 RepID=A0A552PRS9_9CHRO|nr:MAG: hypothetical protein EWV42_06640 [Microcystis panniformis Mp_GB_SS_20050300_S99D]TRV59620.1 MAG: hypothetical protein EWV53_16400 [Microcystis panniformis Mp_MB_F_20051200_S9]TRV64257.1 MAG: hypothetical protein EWV69_01930 [Microcystis panniformis Mp_MB_F_20080800_S26]TRV70378.1 MAG: hypothetical protein EWV51_16675 [Microcystis panniformis Mp_MB_F_20051200_S6]